MLPDGFGSVNGRPPISRSAATSSRIRRMRISPRLTALAIALAFAAGWTLSLPAQQGRQYFTPRTPGDPNVTPFSGAVMSGGMLYVSGTLGLGPNRQVPETAAAEATNVLNNVKAQLDAAGMTMDDLVSVQIYASDTSDYDAFNGVYRTYFTKEFPARAFIGAGPLLFGARFEVVGVAARR
jgi:2-iminobutanoate/2-iminopropanoate deaminase